jgi:NAD(P)H-nitrite reductase large subunit
MFPKQRTQLIKVQVDRDIAKKVASFRIQEEAITLPIEMATIPNLEDEGMVCLCERVKVKDVKALINQGIYDLNQIKAITRAGMGPCGAKTCDVLLKQVMRQMGVPADHVVPNTKRPVFIEAQLSVFAGGKREE